MYKILFITRGAGTLELRQTPGGQGMSTDGQFRFYTNDFIPDPDFVIVRGKGFKDDLRLHVAPENVMLVTSEPYSVLSYPKGYCRQFGLVCSCQDNLRLPNVIYTPAILTWFVGIDHANGLKITMNREDIAAAHPEKTKLISVITSDKAFTQGHIDRIKFVHRLKERYGDKIEIFGRGHRPFGDKWDVLAPYKYHIAIENSSSPYYWTEKISDCYLADTYPLYYGCPNIGDYFPKGAYRPIDIRRPDSAIDAIDRAIADDDYGHHQKELAESKRLVMDKYNMYDYMAEMCRQHMNPKAPKKDITLKPAGSFFDMHNLYLYTIGRNYYKLKNKIESLKRNKI